MKETIEIIGSAGREVIEKKDLAKRIAQGARLADPEVEKKSAPISKPIKKSPKKKGGK